MIPRSSRNILRLTVAWLGALLSAGAGRADGLRLVEIKPDGSRGKPVALPADAVRVFTHEGRPLSVRVLKDAIALEYAHSAVLVSRATGKVTKRWTVLDGWPMVRPAPFALPMGWRRPVLLGPGVAEPWLDPARGPGPVFVASAQFGGRTWNAYQPHVPHRLAPEQRLRDAAQEVRHLDGHPPPAARGLRRGSGSETGPPRPALHRQGRAGEQPRHASRCPRRLPVGGLCGHLRSRKETMGAGRPMPARTRRALAARADRRQASAFRDALAGGGRRTVGRLPRGQRRGRRPRGLWQGALPGPLSSPRQRRRPGPAEGRQVGAFRPFAAARRGGPAWAGARRDQGSVHRGAAPPGPRWQPRAALLDPCRGPGVRQLGRAPRRCRLAAGTGRIALATVRRPEGLRCRPAAQHGRRGRRGPRHQQPRAHRWDARGKAWQRIDTGAPLLNPSVQSVAEVGDELWVGYTNESFGVFGEQGISRYAERTGKWSHFTPGELGTASPVQTMVASPKGDEVWVLFAPRPWGGAAVEFPYYPREVKQPRPTGLGRFRKGKWEFPVKLEGVPGFDGKPGRRGPAGLARVGDHLYVSGPAGVYQGPGKWRRVLEGPVESLGTSADGKKLVVLREARLPGKGDSGSQKGVFDPATGKWAFDAVPPSDEWGDGVVWVARKPGGKGGWAITGIEEVRAVTTTSRAVWIAAQGQLLRIDRAKLPKDGR